MLTYTASGTDCAIPGIWRAQAHVVLASGEPLRTDPDAINDGRVAKRNRCRYTGDHITNTYENKALYKPAADDD